MAGLSVPGPQPSITSLNFDTSGWKFHADKSDQSKRLWETPEHDVVTLHFFAIAPDLPKVASMEDLRAFYANSVQGSPAKIVNVGIHGLAGERSIVLILKVPQKPSGMTYQGALTLPFRDFSYVIKAQCVEHGTTGLREATLVERRIRAGEHPNVGGGALFKDWNPDSSEYDKDFPQHPVSRVRRLLRHVIRTASLESGVAHLAKFELPKE